MKFGQLLTWPQWRQTRTMTSHSRFSKLLTCYELSIAPHCSASTDKIDPGAEPKKVSEKRIKLGRDYLVTGAHHDH